MTTIYDVAGSGEWQTVSAMHRQFFNEIVSTEPSDFHKK